jgi:EAL domain-containing protein (putative c-di-GMP-specific phosphodiesterase class I)
MAVPYLALIVTGINLAVLVCFALGWQGVLRGWSGGPKINPVIAASFLAIGVVMLVDRPFRRSLFTAILTGAVTVTASARLLLIYWHAAGHGERSGAVFTLPPPSTDALTFTLSHTGTVTIFLLAASLTAIRLRKARAAQVLALITAFGLLRSTFNYAYGDPAIFGTVTIPTTLSGVLSILAILGRSAFRPPIRNFILGSATGRFLRKQLFYTVGACLLLLPWATGFHSAGAFNLSAIKISACILALVLIIAEGSYHLDKIERTSTGEAKNDPLLADFDKCWLRGEIILAYQPQIDLTTSRPTGVEVLVRWHHPRKGMIPPDVFIPTIEQSPLIHPFGLWVLRQACTCAAAWRHAELRDLRISVNVSGTQVNSARFMQEVEAIIRETSFPSSRIVLELTETAMMKQSPETLNTVRRLRDLGMQIALDDFGTGYSSLTYLTAFPADYIKIDKSFVRDLPVGSQSAAISRSIIALGRTLGLRIVAEGIETKAQAAFLLASFCDEGQGFLYATPLPEDRLEEWAEAYRASRHA